MKHFFDFVEAGNPGLAGAVITVVDPTSGDTIPIYSDNNGTPIPGNAVTTDDQGDFDFYVANGTYNVEYRYGGKLLKVLKNVDMFDGDVTSAAQTLLTEAQEQAAAAANSATNSLTIYNQILTGYAPAAPIMDLYILMGQSLIVARSPQVTPASQIVPGAYMFNGGPEAGTFNQPTTGSSTWPAAPANMTSMVPLAPLAGVESNAAGMAYQSYIAGRTSFFCSFGFGGQSARLLREGNNFFETLKYGVQQMVRLARAAGYNPNPIVLWVQGHANADTLSDGNVPGETETSTADYLTATTGKIFPSLRRAVSFALGQIWTGPIWVDPLLTGTGVIAGGGPNYTITGRRNINAAQIAMQSSQVRLLPPWSQFIAHSATDVVHPDGQGFRYRGELHAAYVRQSLLPPKMIAKAVVGSTVVVTFDQPIRISTRVPTGAHLAGVSGFEIYDNTVTSVPITSVVPNGSNSAQVIITPTSVANLTGSWAVRNGQQQTPQQTEPVGPDYFPRTFVVGATDVGTAQDGTVMENCSVSQEI